MQPTLKHQLRTPLNHIIGYCELLLEDPALNSLTADLQRIHGAGKRLLVLVDDLLEPEPGDSPRLTESTIHHEIRTPLNQIIGYAEMLQEEAISRGDDRLSEDLQKIHAAGRELLRVVLERLLPASQELTAAPCQGGTSISVRSAQGSPRITASPEAGRILVVDDDEANRSMLARRLERLGHTVEVAENGRRALEKVGVQPAGSSSQAQQFDLMLLDLAMPELDGYQVLTQLKGDPALRHLPVIVLSASDETERIAHCIELGADDYLPKPFDPILLRARIGASLEKKRLRDREVSHLRRIEEEKRRADELLHIILPNEVAEELKTTNRVKPRRFENVAVLFCDIVGFTAYCDDHAPEEVLNHLQTLVEAFERITTENGLEKTKTIGDSFMATAGLLSPLPNPAKSAVRCGLAMIAAARERPPHWEVRVGLHCGPVVAGVIGDRKYQYDIWGDTVNTAARMQQAARPGCLCVNAEVWQTVEPFCRGLSEGRLAIKGKGDHEIFQITAFVDEAH